MSLHTRKTRRTLATARAPPPWSGFARNVAAGEKRSALTTHSTSLLASSQSRSAQIVFLNQPWQNRQFSHATLALLTDQFHIEGKQPTEEATNRALAVR